MRTLSKGLIPVTITGPGLADSLCEIVDQADAIEGVQCTASLDPTAIVISDGIATQLFRIAQESVTNALKHGRADRIHVSLQRDGNLLNLEIRDYGVGLREVSSTPGVGRQIMAFRAELIGGTLSIEQPEDGGTRVICTLPVESGDG